MQANNLVIITKRFKTFYNVAEAAQEHRQSQALPEPSTAAQLKAAVLKSHLPIAGTKTLKPLEWPPLKAATVWAWRPLRTAPVVTDAHIPNCHRNERETYQALTYLPVLEAAALTASWVMVGHRQSSTHYKKHQTLCISSGIETSRWSPTRLLCACTPKLHHAYRAMVGTEACGAADRYLPWAIHPWLWYSKEYSPYTHVFPQRMLKIQPFGTQVCPCSSLRP